MNAKLGPILSLPLSLTLLGTIGLAQAPCGVLPSVRSHGTGTMGSAGVPALTAPALLLLKKIEPLEITFLPKTRIPGT